MPIFGGLRDDAIEFVVDRAVAVDVARGQLFFREGEAADAMFVLQSGRAAVVKDADERLVRTIEPGDCFGEMSLIDLAPRSASVRALDDSRALRISSGCLFELYERDVEQFAIIEMNMGREVSRRLREIDAALGRMLASPRPGAG